MLQNIKHFYGVKIGATDGDIGYVKDFYFDDKTWAIRYLVADTSSWLPGRQVLLTPHAFGEHAFGKFEISANVLVSRLTLEQIEGAPSIDTHRPVSRQDEIDYYAYYGWPNYWDGGMWSVGEVPPGTPPSAKENVHHSDDIHLRSTKAIIGYQIRATDGQIGSVRSLMVDSNSWAIQELVVETGNWYASRTILIRPENITRVGYKESTVFVNLTRLGIKEARKNDVAQITVSQR